MYNVLNHTAEQVLLSLGERVTLKQQKDKSFPVSFPHKPYSYSLKVQHEGHEVLLTACANQASIIALRYNHLNQKMEIN